MIGWGLCIGVRRFFVTSFLRMTDKGGCTGHVILRNRRTEGFAFHKWLCSEESAKVGVIVHWGAEILRHFVPQNDRLVSSLMVDWFTGLLVELVST
jgi:hypothetical protein